MEFLLGLILYKLYTNNNKDTVMINTIQPYFWINPETLNALDLTKVLHVSVSGDANERTLRVSFNSGDVSDAEYTGESDIKSFFEALARYQQHITKK